MAEEKFIIGDAVSSPGVVNVKSFGAKGDGVTDDTAAIQAAISATTEGGTVFIPVGRYLVSGTGPQILLINKNVNIKGEGALSTILVSASVPGSTDVIKFSMAQTSVKTMMVLERFAIKKVSGKPARHAIHIEMLTSSQWISKLRISELTTEQFGGKAVKLTNPTNVDGFFTSKISDNLFYGGGLDFERIGDSVYICNNTITGDGEGIKMTAVEGAVSVVIKENNITSAGGAIRVDSASQVKIINNQIEQVVTYTGSVAALIYVNNSQLPEIKGNNVNARGLVESPIRIGSNVLGAIIDKNLIRSGTGSSIKVEGTLTTVTARNLFINVQEQEIEQSVSDLGLGTSGVRKLLTLQNGWTNSNASVFSSASFIKEESGTVVLSGNISAGTKTPGTVIGNLPARFRPKRTLRLGVTTYDTAITGISTAVILIEQAGNVVVESYPSTGIRLDLDGISFSTL